MLVCKKWASAELVSHPLLWVMRTNLFSLGIALVGWLAVSVAPVSAQTTNKGFVLAPAALGASPAKVGDHFGDWVFECAALGEGQTLCSLNQTLIAKNSNKAIARFSLSRDKKSNENILGVLVPLGLDIPVGVAVNIDQNPPIPLTLLTCSPNGCVANAVLNPKAVDAFKVGKALSLSFKIRGADKPMNLAGSLNGLAAGIAATGVLDAR